MAKEKQLKGRPLNLRNFPDELYWKAKLCAANRRMSLKAYIVAAVEEATARDIGAVHEATAKKAR
jgi:hypothetical protein